MSDLMQTALSFIPDSEHTALIRDILPATIKKLMIGEDDYNEEEAWRVLLKASRANRDDAIEQWELLPEDYKKVLGLLK